MNFSWKRVQFDAPTDADEMRTRRGMGCSGALFASLGRAASAALPGTHGRRRGSRSVSPDCAVGDDSTVAVGASLAGEVSVAGVASVVGEAAVVGAAVWARGFCVW